MNRHALLLSLSLITLLSLLACQPTAAPDTNRDAAKTANANTERPIDRAGIEAEILRLEREWNDVVKTHNADTVRRILSDDVVMTYPDGSTGTKADEVRDAEAGAFTADVWDMVEPRVAVLSNDVAVVTGRTSVKNGKYKPATGKPFDISGEYRFTDVYARRNGTWQVIASQATKITNPEPPPAASPKSSASGPPSPPAKASPSAAAKATP